MLVLCTSKTFVRIIFSRLQKRIEMCVGLLFIKYWLIYSEHNLNVSKNFSKLGKGQNFQKKCCMVLESLEIGNALLKTVNMAFTLHAQD